MVEPRGAGAADRSELPPHAARVTGGDPLMRPDVDDLVARGSQLGLSMAVSPSVTARVTRGRLVDLRRAGARVVSFSLDGANAENHDSFRRSSSSPPVEGGR